MNRVPFLFDPTRWSDWQHWLDDQQTTLAQHGTRIVIIVLLLLALEFLFRRVLGRVFVRAITRAAAARLDDALAIQRRADTLLATLNWAFGIFLLFLGTGLVLSELGLNVSALIAGVGVVGIALGLGAQTLVKDVINGMFILIEDQYAVGDLVTVAGATGTVVEINPRRTVLRDTDGNVHSIPNSAITVATNRTAGLNRVRVQLRASFEEADKVAKVASDIAREVGVKHAPLLLRFPALSGRRLTGEDEVTLVLTADARDGARWEVEADLRRSLERALGAAELKVTFEGEGKEGAS